MKIKLKQTLIGKNGKIFNPGEIFDSEKYGEVEIENILHEKIGQQPKDNAKEVNGTVPK